MGNKLLKLFLFILISLSSVDANDILDEYRINGIKNIKNKMDLELTKQNYWSELLKDKNTTFGYIEAFSSVLTCNKEKSMLTLYSQDTNKTYRFEKKYYAFTGEIKGDKIKEGDLRTPIGIYQLTKRIDKLDSFYGPLALVTSYPNTYDKYRGKNGSGIWIHGLPTEQERDEFTKGCIAINNENIKCLDKRINIDKTLLIINQTELSVEVSKEQLASILSQLYKWRYSWLYNDLSTYLDFYSEDFIRDDGMNFEMFKKYKTKIFKKVDQKTIIFNDINVIPYPNSSNIFQITFKEFYSAKNFSFTGDKTLMVRVDSNNTIKIFTEK